MTDLESSDTFEGKRSTDKVRASRDGHAYHEAWAARSALELLPPRATLCAIALEGFSIEDISGLSESTIEIADVVRYHGFADVARASRVEVVQFKYSIARADAPIRAADISKTLKKFAVADVDFRTKYGDALVERVIRYDFATNRPIHSNLIAAIAALRSGVQVGGDVAQQAEQIITAVKFARVEMLSFLSRLELSGGRGSLKQVDRSVQHVLANWGKANDPQSEKQLLKLRNLIRNKVGSDGEGSNLVDRIAVLGELEIDHEDVLYPTPDAFPPVSLVVERPVVADVVAAAKTDRLPLIVHGAGGMGKTVLMQAVAERLLATDHVITFDGFGAGKWRDPADGRHRPERTLVHLANLLAGQGLCDILLPVSDEIGLVRAFRRRLGQSVAAARQASDDAGVVLILDAIDHAAIEADATGTRSFVHILLKSLSVDPIDGVWVVASCRTERLSLSVGAAGYREIAIPPFSNKEARELILTRDSTARPVEVAALEGRSGLNPRCLDALLTAGRPYDGPRLGSETDTASTVLDALLRKRIDAAKAAARAKGAADADIDMLLSALSILPPPVPTAELAAAHGLDAAEVESFASDLAPLLERTPHGLMFRDEPTETLIRSISKDDVPNRDRVVLHLHERQLLSDYAARALPAVLTSLRRVDLLFNLAFDERVPPGASKVSQRDIRLSRIVAALNVCAQDGRRDDLMRLLLEASLVAAGHERSDRFLYEHPDLTAIAGDTEALRRLFSTKAGWPGGRHAALALANAFAGDIGEARRNSQRAIDWHNWSVSQQGRDNSSRGYVRTDRDHIGFSYVEMLAGNQLRVARWLANRSEGEAYTAFTDLFDLLERHAASDGTVPKDKLFDRIARCHLSTRAFWAAALRYSAGEPLRDQRLIGRLAAAPTPLKAEALPSTTVLAAAACAISMGLRSEARTILEKASIRPPSVHDFSSYWPIDRDSERAVILAGLTSALRGTTPTLLDLAPREFLELVPKSIRSRGPKAFAAKLEKLLAENKTNTAARRKPRKETLGYEERGRYGRALQYRIAPLVDYARFISRLVSEPRGANTSAILNEALDRLDHDVKSASDYPYRDGKPYIARIGFSVLFAIADAIGGIDKTTGIRIVEWLRRAPGLFTPLLTQVVARLSRSSALHEAALDLAVHVEALILTDTDTVSRISAYGELARAVWRVSPDEAAAYFRRSLDLADAVGSGDFDRMNHLLDLVGHYSGNPLLPTASHDLARIFDLNQSEASKFPWIEYGRAMASVAGAPSLAVIARLDDRDKAKLGLSLGPLLTTLVSTDKLPPDLATCLIGLEEPIESWTWRIGAFVKSTLKNLAVQQREWLFDTILIEIDRKDRLVPWPETLRDLLTLATDHLPTTSAALGRLQALAGRTDSPEPALRQTQVEETLIDDGVDVSDPDAIDRAIESDASADSGHFWPQRTLQRLARRASTPASRHAFVNAVTRASGAKLSDKLRALEDFVRDWARSSAALRDQLSQIATALVSKHATEMVGHSWDAHYAWRQLTTTFNADRTLLVAQVIASLSKTSKEVSGDSWLALAAQLAPAVGDAAFRNGLERFLTSAGTTLPYEVGDGPWTDRYAIIDDPVDITAGLIWSRLGNFAAASRWRAAHAVRRLATADRFDVIDSIVAHFDGSNVSPFCDAKLPFYTFHARLWLLIALARIAKDHPSKIARYRPLLENVAFDAAFPHVAMRAFARDSLNAILPSLDQKDAEALSTKLLQINVSLLPRETRKRSETGLYSKRPEDTPAPENRFHLEYDFNKYQASDLVSIFGCTGWELEDAVTRWVRRWDSTIRAMYDCPRIGKGDFNVGSWSGGSTPEVDRYGGYLGWHALMLVAGEMLAARPVSSDHWRGDPWSNFLRDVNVSRIDGLWLSDATDLAPTNLVTSLQMPETDTKKSDPTDQRVLAPMLSIIGNQIGEILVVSGSWSLPGDISINIGSVLANRADAQAAIMATLTDEKFHRWLPHDKDNVERQFRIANHSVTAWLESNDHADRLLDRHDPYASPAALKRPSPEAWVLEFGGLQRMDPVGRFWKSADGSAFVADAWGVTGGRGENTWDESGERISVNTNFLRTLLSRESKLLVGFISARLYISDRNRRVGGDTGAFTHRTMAFTVDEQLRMKIITRISNKARSVLASTTLHDRTEFHARFAALRAAERR
jgi:hypothetical protein